MIEINPASAQQNPFLQSPQIREKRAFSLKKSLNFDGFVLPAERKMNALIHHVPASLDRAQKSVSHMRQLGAPFENFFANL